MSKILLFGGTGLVGSRVLELLSKNFEFIAPTSEEVDLSKKDIISKYLDGIKADQILYAAGYTNVDKAEEEKELCFLLNADAPKTIAQKALNLNIPFHYLSTDYVFDGTKSDRPYTEEDQPDPADEVYAKSKREGEIVTMQASDKNSIIRLIMPFSAVYRQKADIARIILTKLQNGEKLSGIVDQKVNPIFVDDLVSAIEKLLSLRAAGIYHVGAINFTTPYFLMKEIAKQFNLNEDLINEISFDEYSKTRAAKRPQHTWLDTSKFRSEFGEGILHTVEEEIRLFKSQIDSRRGFS